MPALRTQAVCTFKRISSLQVLLVAIFHCYCMSMFRHAINYYRQGNSIMKCQLLLATQGSSRVPTYASTPTVYRTQPAIRILRFIHYPGTLHKQWPCLAHFTQCCRFGFVEVDWLDHRAIFIPLKQWKHLSEQSMPWIRYFHLPSPPRRLYVNPA